MTIQDVEGLNGSRKALEDEARGIKFTAPNITESALLYHMRNGLRNSEKVWDLYLSMFDGDADHDQINVTNNAVKKI